MTEDSARSILRLIAVVVIMVGLGMAVYTVIGQVGASRAMAGVSAGVQVQVSGAIGQLGLFAVLADMGISALGFGLFALSPKLAVKIVE